VLLKLIPLVIPLIIYFLAQIAKEYIKSAFNNKPANTSETMVSCSKCGTFVHESLVINKLKKGYCSKECLNS
tara:strand:+ start:156 stop:371 length:216 start_codon:yes stop_codon:yes gene_type:complete